MPLVLTGELVVDPDLREVIDGFEAQPDALVITGRQRKLALVEPRLLIDRAQVIAPIRLMRMEDRLQMGALRDGDPITGGRWRLRVERGRLDLPIAGQAMSGEAKTRIECARGTHAKTGA